MVSGFPCAPRNLCQGHRRDDSGRFAYELLLRILFVLKSNYKHLLQRGARCSCAAHLDPGRAVITEGACQTIGQFAGVDAAGETEDRCTIGKDRSICKCEANLALRRTRCATNHTSIFLSGQYR